ncbi:MAG: hypothetical protein ABI725_05195, partial [Chloroflexota bacterium]
LWDVATRTPIGELTTGHADDVHSVAFSPDGMTFASGGSDGVMLWDVATRTPIGELTTGDADGVHSVAFSPDGRTLASGGEDSNVILWDVATGKPIGEPLTGDTDGVANVAFSPGGMTFASGGEDNVILWGLDRDDWVTIACRIANRNLSLSEWKHFLGEEPYHETCPGLPRP